MKEWTPTVEKVTSRTPVESTARQDLSTPQSIEKVMCKQSFSAIHGTVMSSVGQRHSEYQEYKSNILLRHSQIYGAFQIIVPQPLPNAYYFPRIFRLLPDTRDSVECMTRFAATFNGSTWQTKSIESSTI